MEIFLHAARGDGLDAVDGVHGLFDDVRDVDFHDLGTCADQLCRDVHDRKIDLREEIEGKSREGHHAEHDEGQSHHGHEYRAFN